MAEDTQNNRMPRSIETSFRRVSAIAGTVLVIFFNILQTAYEYRTDLTRLEDRIREIERSLNGWSRELLESGFADVLEKPLTMFQLSTALHHVQRQSAPVKKDKSAS